MVPPWNTQVLGQKLTYIYIYICIYIYILYIYIYIYVHTHREGFFWLLFVDAFAMAGDAREHTRDACDAGGANVNSSEAEAVGSFGDGGNSSISMFGCKRLPIYDRILLRPKTKVAPTNFPR